MPHHIGDIQRVLPGALRLFSYSRMRIFHALILLGGFLLVSAQWMPATDVMAETQTIYLVPVTLADTVKYGIYATIGGDADGAVMPQLYEFDTGGDGFYAAFGGPKATAWGTNYVSTGQPVSNSYNSGDYYQGTAVTAPVSLYSAKTDGSSDTTPSLQTANDILVGQTTSITNTKGKDNNWPTPADSSSGPIQSSFWGDFGMSLKANNNGIMNVIAQIQYTNNIKSGFIVKLGKEDNQRPSIQVGLTVNDMASFPIQIFMSGKDSNSVFPHTTISTYSGQILTNNLVLSDSASGSYTNGIGVTLDTGATPKLHDYSDDTSALTNYFTTDGSDTFISDNVQFVLTAVQTNGTTIPIFQLTTGLGDTNYIPIEFGNDFYINMGASIFHEYDVMYDLEDGVLGLRPIPEVSQALYMGCGLAALILFGAARTARRHCIRATIGKSQASALLGRD
jgi:hypothetical protein